MGKKVARRKVRKDKKQDVRIKSLEQFVYKTIENKQTNYRSINNNVSSLGLVAPNVFTVSQGTEDGAQPGDRARIGNSVTVMNQRLNATLSWRAGHDEFNQVRMLLVESTDGNENLDFTDILQDPTYALGGAAVFSSAYTTKTSTNRRYKVHFDKCVTLTALKPAFVIKHNIKYKGGKVYEFDNLSVTPTSNNLHFMVISDSVAIQHPRLDYNIRTTFKDA